jgi:hypothetical protein
MPDISKGFGLIIAFLQPGLVGLYALSYVEPAIREWFGLASTQNASVGGFLFVVVASVGMGVFLSGLRWLVLDWAFADPPAVDSRRRAIDPQTEAIYEDIRSQHYRYYQFYANMLCAIVLLYVAWFATTAPSWPVARLRFGVLVVACVILFLSARDAVTKYDQKVLHLLADDPRIEL